MGGAELELRCHCVVLSGIGRHPERKMGHLPTVRLAIS